MSRQRPVWSEWMTFVTCWLRPRATALRTNHAGLARAFAVHLTAVLLGVALASFLNAWRNVGTDAGLGGICARVERDWFRAARHFQRRPGASAGVVITYVAAGELAVIVLAAAFLAPRRAAVTAIPARLKRSLRRVWLQTPHALVAFLLVGLLNVVLDEAKRPQWAEDRAGVPLPDPPPVDNPSQASLDEFRGAAREFGERWWKMSRQRRGPPWYITHHGKVRLAGYVAAGVWFLCGTLAGLGARHLTPRQVSPRSRRGTVAAFAPPAALLAALMLLLVRNWPRPRETDPAEFLVASVSDPTGKYVSEHILKKVSLDGEARPAVPGLPAMPYWDVAISPEGLVTASPSGHSTSCYSVVTNTSSRECALADILNAHHGPVDGMLDVAFSHDGAIAFVSGWDRMDSVPICYVVDLVNRRLIRVELPKEIRHVWWAGFSPDGSTIAFYYGDLLDPHLNILGVGIADLEGHARSLFPQSCVYPGESLWPHAPPAWSPDGKRIYFTAGPVIGLTSHEAADNAAYRAHCYEITLATGRVERLSAGILCGIAPDGSYLVLSGPFGLASSGKLDPYSTYAGLGPAFRLDLATHEVTQLPIDAEVLKFSLSGRFAVTRFHRRGYSGPASLEFYDTRDWRLIESVELPGMPGYLEWFDRVHWVRAGAAGAG